MGVKLSTTVEQTLCFPPPSLTQRSVLVKKRCWRWVVGGTHEVAKGSFTESYNYPYYYYWSNIISKIGGNPMRMYLYLHWLPSTGFTRTYFSIPVNSFHENFMDKSTLFFCLYNEVSVTAQRHHISKHVYCFLCAIGCNVESTAINTPVLPVPELQWTTYNINSLNEESKGWWEHRLPINVRGGINSEPTSPISFS